MGAFKLGKMTLGSLFKKPATVRYPYEVKPAPEGLKGQIAIDMQQCILCGMCERGCTTGCLTVSKGERFWEIDRYRCVQCGYCITICPKKCLAMLPSYATVAPQRTSERFAVPEKEGKGDGKARERKAVAEAEARRGDQPAAEVQPLQKAPSAAEEARLEALDHTATLEDHQLDDLLRLMDEGRAAKVRNALGDLSASS